MVLNGCGMNTIESGRINRKELKVILKEKKRKLTLKLIVDYGMERDAKREPPPTLYRRQTLTLQTGMQTDEQNASTRRNLSCVCC